MSAEEKHHWIVVHIWRALRALCILLGTSVWLLQDGMQVTDMLVLGFFTAAVIIDQLHGYICRRIQKALNWKEDFNDYE